MERLQEIHDPDELAALELAGEPWALRDTIDGPALAVRTGREWPGLSVITYAVEPQPDDDDDAAGRPRPVGGLPSIGEEVILVTVRVEVYLEGTRASLVRQLSGNRGPHLDLCRIDELTKPQLTMLLRGRHLANLNWRYTPRPGRPVGSAKLSPAAFEAGLRAILLERRHNRVRPRVPSQVVLADLMGISERTIRTYLGRVHVTWKDVASGRWPPRLI